MKKLLRSVTMTAAILGISSAVATGASASTNANVKAKATHKVVNVAHRGASGYAPEHTIQSYKLGDKMGGQYIELDLQMTKDGELIAMHDESVNRTTNGSGQVRNLTLKQIKELDAGSWFNEANPIYAKKSYVGAKVPTLEEIFQTMGSNKNYYIETKSPEIYPGMEKKLLKLVNKYHINKNTLLIQSFSKQSLLKVKRLDPSIKLIQLLEFTEPHKLTQEELDEYKLYAYGIGPNFETLSEKFVKRAVKNGLQVHPWTVNEISDMKRLIKWGVTGMFSNYPARVKFAIQEARQEK
ncbi:glycerophosphoryl diester phosphodiesterase [Fictibacillus macauensis ZFHKF-1]|uniref:Glycerophosphoryl diester phosphodiesterase n=1 Tax=Fictibacillus macauensis ZFHKF-1 TaxID=1196324 RepID=I8UH36_9BACL|nr:glycerophosphodiester phosphodiesterase [Fictibacillus macauensis]EIT86215.1 glycerophosphoryl diester phosphodiesterase [Fictibacillus macauensis ZFHKF-1]